MLLQKLPGAVLRLVNPVWALKGKLNPLATIECHRGSTSVSNGPSGGLPSPTAGLTSPPPAGLPSIGSREASLPDPSPDWPWND